jgi:hypothetical protein
VRANLTHPKCVAAWYRTGSLTPYLAEVLVEDALHLGHGAHLDVTVFPLPCEAALTQLKKRLFRLVSRGVDVTLQGDCLAAAEQPGQENAQRQSGVSPSRWA